MKDDRYAVPGRIITVLHGKNRLGHIGTLCSQPLFAVRLVLMRPGTTFQPSFMQHAG